MHDMCHLNFHLATHGTRHLRGRTLSVRLGMVTQAGVWKEGDTWQMDRQSVTLYAMENMSFVIYQPNGRDGTSHFQIWQCPQHVAGVAQETAWPSAPLL